MVSDTLITNGVVMAKILIAEDDKFLANAYRVKLTKAGFEVKIAANGEEAVEALKEFEPDIMLLDLVMPKKDGFSVLEDLRNDEKWKNLPIIVASNLGQQEDVDKAKKLGANDYVVKSNESLQNILDKIAQHIK